MLLTAFDELCQFFLLSAFECFQIFIAAFHDQCVLAHVPDLQRVTSGSDYIGWNNVEIRDGKSYPNRFFANPDVRRAITHALNRAQILEEYLYNYGKLSAGPVSPLYKNAFDDSVQPLKYDPDMAQKMLSDAGWRDSDGNGILDKDGLEFSFEYETVNNLQLKTATEYVWNKNLDTKLPLPFTPPFSIFGELEYGKDIQEHFLKYYFVSVNYHFFADQNRVDRNEQPTPGYDLVTLGAGIDVKIQNQTARLRLSVNNLFNVSYMNHLSRYRLLNLPEQGRNIVLSLNIPFDI